MVGAKQFAILRKIIEEKEENPILQHIHLPNYITGYNKFEDVSGAIMDLPMSDPRIKKLLKHDVFVSFKPVFEPKNEKEEMISEHFVNLLSEKVFANIKDYFASMQEENEEKDKRKININITI